SQSPNRRIGPSFRLARSRSRAIPLPRHQVARDGPGLLDDLRLSLDPTAPHQHDTIADRRVDDVPVGGVHPIAQVGMAGREFRTSGSTRMRSARRSTPMIPASIPRARAPPRFASSNASIAGRAFGSPLAN